MSLKSILRTVMFQALALCLACAVQPVHAQIPTYTSPQTVQQTLAAPGTACTGSPQNFTAMNLGQTQHYASIVVAGSTTKSTMAIWGQDNAGNITQISDLIQPAGVSGGPAIVTGTGYFPKVFVSVDCSGGTFSVNYSGTSATSNTIAGQYLLSQIDKTIFLNIPENANTSSLVNQVPPFGSTAGTLIVTYSTASIAGSTLQVSCSTSVGSATPIYSFALANVLTLQTFNVPATPCAALIFIYSSGGAGAGTVTVEYVFNVPGTPNSAAPCPTAVPVVVGAGATQQVVAPVSTQKVRVCGLYLSVTTGGTLTITEGTGATCGTGTTNVSGAMTLATGSAPIISGGGPTMQTNVAGDGLCLTSGTAVVAGWAQVLQY
jgi:hypothetical protein